MKKKIIMMTAAMVMGLSSLTLTACTAETSQTAAATVAATEAATIEIASVDALPETTAPVPETTAAMEGGVLIIKVNPEIAVEYDKDGIVTAVTARNNEAIAIINQCEGLIGSKTRDAVSRIVTAIGDAGYFVEDMNSSGRQIVLEIEAGSSMPYEGFMDEVVDDVRTCVGEKHWEAPFDVVNESDYGITDYVDTDYGPDNDGVTDYADTDYGPNNDGVTDYADTDYGPNNDGVTDYGYTDYGQTDYEPAPTQPPAPAPTQPPAPAPTQAPAPAPAPQRGDSGYGNSNYGNSGYGASDYGNSNYGNSGYGDSGYDD